MKKILALLLTIATVLSLGACANSGANTETTATTAEETKKTPETTTIPEYDNKLLTTGGSVNLTPSDYRIVDETDFGYVILLLNGTGVKSIHKVVVYESTEKAIEFLVSITNDGTAKNYPELGQVTNFFYYTLGVDDATYGKFYTMSRKDVLAAFGRDVDTTAAETEHDHQH